MKTIKWEDCRQFSIGAYPTQKSHMLLSDDAVEPDMHVVAKYKGLDVHLRITKEIKPGIFSAIVMFFEPVLAKPLDDLVAGDEVEIARSDICCIYEKK